MVEDSKCIKVASTIIKFTRLANVPTDISRKAVLANEGWGIKKFKWVFNLGFILLQKDRKKFISQSFSNILNLLKKVQNL